MRGKCLLLVTLLSVSGLSFARKLGILDGMASQIPSPGNSEDNGLPAELRDAVHGVKMGVSSDACDNAVDNLDVDWDGSPVNYSCYHPKSPFPVHKKMKPLVECDLPKNYYPNHVCMSEKIAYNVSIPTYGNHRPLWPVYGEYVFVPVQRWLHNLEHGAIIMLYHPCAEPLEIKRLKILVKSCLRKHIITPYKELPVDRPLALISWGCKALISHVEKDFVIQFIKEHALQAPEGSLPKQGQYRYKLIQKAFTVPGSNYKDAELCPFL